MTSDITQRKHADTHEHFDKKVLFTIQCFDFHDGKLLVLSFNDVV